MTGGLLGVEGGSPGACSGRLLDDSLHEHVGGGSRQPGPLPLLAVLDREALLRPDVAVGHKARGSESERRFPALARLSGTKGKTDGVTLSRAVSTNLACAAMLANSYCAAAAAGAAPAGAAPARRAALTAAAVNHALAQITVPPDQLAWQPPPAAFGVVWPPSTSPSWLAENVSFSAVHTASATGGLLHLR